MPPYRTREVAGSLHHEPSAIDSLRRTPGGPAGDRLAFFSQAAACPGCMFCYEHVPIRRRSIGLPNRLPYGSVNRGSQHRFHRRAQLCGHSINRLLIANSFRPIIRSGYGKVSLRCEASHSHRRTNDEKDANFIGLAKFSVFLLSFIRNQLIVLIDLNLTAVIQHGFQ